jgi:hypothetical protein
MADTPSARAHWNLASNPRPEHRSGRDDRRGRERASFGRLGRPESTSSAAAAAQLPRPTRRVGQDERTPAPRGLGDRGLHHRVGAVCRDWGATPPGTKPTSPSSKAFRLLPYASRKAASACSLGYASACGDTQGSGQGGAGVQPTCLCASFNQRRDAERAPRQRQANANAQRGSANQHADYDRIQLSVTVVDCRLLVLATRSRAAGGSMSLLRS